jgi:HlyD family secretion protein
MSPRNGILSIKWIVIATLITLSGGGYWWYQTHKTPMEEHFKFESIDQGPILKTVSANGTLNPVVLVNVGTQVSGTVKKLEVDFNDHVKKGQVMAILDPSLFNAQIAQSKANVSNAQAGLELAQANQQRSRELYEKHYLSHQDYDTSTHELASAKASLALAKAQLQHDQTNKNYSIITSPVSGVVVDRQIDIGQTVAASFQTPTLFKIAQDLRKMQIDANFAEADIGQIRTGQHVNFNVDAFPDRTFEGIVKQIRMNATTTSNVVTYDIVVTVDNPQEILLPGMTAYVTIIEDQRQNALLVPNAALRFHPTTQKMAKLSSRQRMHNDDSTKGHLFVLQNGQLKKITITTGITDGKYTEIVKGSLKANDKVIVNEITTKVSGQDRNGKSGSPMKMF